MTPDLTLSAVQLTPRPLERQAVIYIRQSSPKQVREHLDSQLTQRARVGRAQSLAWHPERTAVFDGDLGQSATGIHERDDFKALAAEIALGHIGGRLRVAGVAPGPQQCGVVSTAGFSRPLWDPHWRYRWPVRSPSL